MKSANSGFLSQERQKATLLLTSLLERAGRVFPKAEITSQRPDDSTTWTKPWTAVIHLTRSAEKMYEVACHEGNHYSMQGVLAGARAEEKAADDAAKRRPK
jgi:hypothetical protein